MENSIQKDFYEMQEMKKMLVTCLPFVENMIIWLNSKIHLGITLNPDMESTRLELMALRVTIYEILNYPIYDDIGNARNSTPSSSANERQREPDDETNSDYSVALTQESEDSLVRNLSTIFEEESGDSDNEAHREQREWSINSQIERCISNIVNCSNFRYLWTPSLVRLKNYIVNHLKYLIEGIRLRREAIASGVPLNRANVPNIRLNNARLLGENMRNRPNFLLSTPTENPRPRAEIQPVVYEPLVYEPVNDPASEPVGESAGPSSKPASQTVGKPPRYILMCNPFRKTKTNPQVPTNPQASTNQKSTELSGVLTGKTGPRDLNFGQRSQETCLMFTNKPGENRGLRSFRTSGNRQIASTSQDETSPRGLTLGNDMVNKNNDKKKTSNNRKRKNSKNATKRKCGNKRSRNTCRGKRSTRIQNAGRMIEVGGPSDPRPANIALEVARNNSNSSSTDDEEYHEFNKKRRLSSQRSGENNSPSAQGTSNPIEYVARRPRTKNTATNAEEGKEPNKSNMSGPHFDSDQSFGGTTEEDSVTLSDEGPQNFPAVSDDGNSAYDVSTDDESSSATYENYESHDQGHSDDLNNAYNAQTDEDSTLGFNFRGDESQAQGGNNGNPTPTCSLQINEEPLNVLSFIQEESPHWRIENVFSLQTDDTWSLPAGDNAAESQENGGNIIVNPNGGDVPMQQNGHFNMGANIGQPQENYWHVINPGNAAPPDENFQFPFNANVGQLPENIWNHMAAGPNLGAHENCHFHFNASVGNPQQNFWHCMNAGNAVQPDEHHQFHFGANVGESQPNYWHGMQGMNTGNHVLPNGNCQFQFSGNVGESHENCWHGMNPGNFAETDENNQIPFGVTSAFGETEENYTRTTEHCVEIQDNNQVIYTVKVEESQEYFMNYTYVTDVNDAPPMQEPPNVLSESHGGLQCPTETDNNLITGDDIYLNCPMQLCGDSDDSQEFCMEGDNVNRNDAQMCEESTRALNFKDKATQEPSGPYRPDDDDDGALGDDEDEDSQSVICIDDVKTGRKKVKARDVQTNTEITSETLTEKNDEGEEDEDEEDGGEENEDEEEDEEGDENENGGDDEDNNEGGGENGDGSGNNKDEGGQENEEDGQENEKKKDGKDNENDDKDDGSDSVICIDDSENDAPQGSSQSFEGSGSGCSVDSEVARKYFPKEFNEEMKQEDIDRNSQEQSSSKNAAEPSISNVIVSTENKRYGNNVTTICKVGGEKRKEGDHASGEQKQDFTPETNPTEQNPTEENPTEENPTEENPAEENPTAENSTEENPTEENRIERNRNEQNRSRNRREENLPGRRRLNYVNLGIRNPLNKFCLVSFDRYGVVGTCYALPASHLVINAQRGTIIQVSRAPPNPRMESRRSAIESRRSEIESRRSEIESRRPEIEPRRPEIEPGRSGMEPGRAGVEPGRPGVEPGRPGTESGRPGTESGRPGIESGRPGIESGRPGTESGRPGIEFGRPGMEFRYEPKVENIPMDEDQSDRNEKTDSDDEEVVVLKHIKPNQQSAQQQSVIKFGRRPEPTATQTTPDRPDTPAVSTTGSDVESCIRKAGPSPGKLKSEKPGTDYLPDSNN